MQVGCELTTVHPLGSSGAPVSELGLPGHVQRKNAAIAIALCQEFDALVAGCSRLQPDRCIGAGLSSSQARGAQRRCDSLQASRSTAASAALPTEYLAGLRNTRLPGRAQCISMPVNELPSEADRTQSNGAAYPDDGLHEDGVLQQSQAAEQAQNVVFCLDGAHTPESMAACAHWFADASAQAAEQPNGRACTAGQCASCCSADDPMCILLFNCMTTREPDTLLPPLARASGSARATPRPASNSRAPPSRHAAARASSAPPLLHHAMFVPSQSQYSSVEPASTPAVDLTWQRRAAAAWESLRSSCPAACGATAPPGAEVQHCGCLHGSLQALTGRAAFHAGTASVHASLPAALAALRRAARAAPARRMHVLVTGSMHLVGDVLRLLGRPPT